MGGPPSRRYRRHEPNTQQPWQLKVTSPRAIDHHSFANLAPMLRQSTVLFAPNNIGPTYGVFRSTKKADAQNNAENNAAHTYQTKPAKELLHMGTINI